MDDGRGISFFFFFSLLVKKVMLYIITASGYEVELRMRRIISTSKAGGV